jgi:hypothetical protein
MKDAVNAMPQFRPASGACPPHALRRKGMLMLTTAPGTNPMPRFALTLVVLGLLAILLTVLLVMGDATLPGRVPPFFAAALAGIGGVALVAGLWLLDGAGPAPAKGPAAGR